MSEMQIALAASSAAPRTRRPVETVRTLSQMDRLASAWERMASGRNPVTDFAYARAWAAGMTGTHRLHIMAAGSPETLALAPLAANTAGPGG